MPTTTNRRFNRKARKQFSPFANNVRQPNHPELESAPQAERSSDPTGPSEHRGSRVLSPARRSGEMQGGEVRRADSEDEARRAPNTQYPPTAASCNALALQMRANAAAGPQEPGPDYDQPVPVSEVKGEPVKWILPGWIPAGKISVLFGEPGVGKSQLSLDIAARLTSGKPMPRCDSASPFPFREGGRGVRHEASAPLDSTSPSQRPTPNAERLPSNAALSQRPTPNAERLPSNAALSQRPTPNAERLRSNAALSQRPTPNAERLASNVLLFSAEDSVADTIKPRLEAAGADCDRVRVFLSGGHGAFADPVMLAILIRTHAASLVIVDPLTAYAGRRDIYRDQHMRRMLGPLAVAAHKTGAAILLIHHTNKSGRGSALMRSAGSIGITAAARSVMMVGKDPDDPCGRILASVKSNLGVPPASIRFRFVKDEGKTHSRIQWDGAVEHITADALFDRKNESSAAIQNARTFIIEKLTPGPMSSKRLEHLANEHGISSRTFDRVKSAITVSRRVGRIGGGGEWQTELKEPSSP